MGYPAGLSANLKRSSGDAAEEVVRSGAMLVEIVRLEDGSALDWQRCPVGDRVFVVTEGRGNVYRSHGRDEVRDEISHGDTVHLKRLLWHRLVAASGEKLVGVLVTAPPTEIEHRL